MVQRLWNSITSTYSARKYLVLLIFIHSFIHLLNKYFTEDTYSGPSTMMWITELKQPLIWKHSQFIKTRQCVQCYDEWKHRESREYEEGAWPGWFKEGLHQRSLRRDLRERSKEEKQRVFGKRYGNFTLPSVVRERGKLNRSTWPEYRVWEKTVNNCEKWGCPANPVS